MVSVAVRLADARERRLPLISVRSGAPADGFAEAGHPPYVVRVPLTQTEFDQVLELRRRQRSAMWGGVACLGIGAALARFPVLLPLAATIALLSVALWGVCRFQLRRRLPRVEPGPRAGEVTLHGVHRAFAAAVAPGDA